MSSNGDQLRPGDGVLRPRQHSQLASPLRASRAAVQSGAVAPSPLELQARRRQHTPDVVAAARSIDAAPTPQAQVEVRKWLQEVYEARGSGPLIGLFGHCYLGGPYIDHVIGLDGVIVEHYTPLQAVPAPYVSARPFAVSEAYAYIEIYADGQIIPVRPDGTPVV